MIVLGWDIGGSNTKICRIVDGRVEAVVSRPFEVKDAPQELTDLLRAMAAEVGDSDADAHAVTMTAELSRAFLTKREGVAFVLDAVEAALAAPRVRVFSVDGVFLTPSEARREPLRIAAANWMATASWLARTHHDALLVDIGSTSTDIIPIVAGRVVAEGRTDPDRLASGELLYSGAMRTPVEALAADVCVQGRRYALAAEAFATTADVHTWRGDLPAEREGASHRLARALCSDRELMDDAAVTALADALAAAQVERVAAAIGRVAARHPTVRRAVVAGAGAFIARRAACVAGLEVVGLAGAQGDAVSECAPAVAVALLLDAGRRIDVVVKVGGGLLVHGEALRAVFDLLDRSSHALVVPGGGPYADEVRASHARGDLDDRGAHWAAVSSMEQYGRVLVDGVARAVRVDTSREAGIATACGRVPVLMPERWLREADPLPHSWDVTSDSIAAWVAGVIGAGKLILIKPPGATGILVDAYFEQALPAGLDVHVVPADQVERLREALRSTAG